MTTGKFQSTTLNDAYFDRNQAVQLAAHLARDMQYRVWVKPDIDDSAFAVLYIDLPQGQVSWRIPQQELVESWPLHLGNWDGHNLDTKRSRIRRFLNGELS